jgi:hypothetical protein
VFYEQTLYSLCSPPPHKDRRSSFYVLAVGWLCENPGGIEKVENVKPVFFKTKQISTGNHFEEEGFYLDEL